MPLKTSGGGGGGAGVPIGGVIMWFGTRATIPTGFQECDRTNGTQDLRGYFLKGAAAAQNAGVVGGTLNSQHAHNGITNIQTATAVQSGAGATRTIAHQHTYTTDDGGSDPLNKTVIFIQRMS